MGLQWLDVTVNFAVSEHTCGLRALLGSLTCDVAHSGSCLSALGTSEMSAKIVQLTEERRASWVQAVQSAGLTDKQRAAIVALRARRLLHLGLLTSRRTALTAVLRVRLPPEVK